MVSLEKLREYEWFERLPASLTNKIDSTYNMKYEKKKDKNNFKNCDAKAVSQFFLNLKWKYHNKTMIYRVLPKPKKNCKYLISF